MIDHHRRGCIFHQPIFVSKDMVGYAMETYAYASTFNSMIMFLHLRLRYDIYFRQIDKIINLKYEWEWLSRDNLFLYLFFPSDI